MAQLDGNVGTGVGVVVALSLAAVLIAYLLVPVGLSAISGDQARTVNQSVDSSINLIGPVEANLTKVVEGTSATVEVNDTDDGNAAISSNISVGNFNVYSLSGGDINVTAEHVNTSTTAKLTYAYPNDYGVSSGTSGLLGIIGVMIALAIILMIVGWAMHTI